MPPDFLTAVGREEGDGEALSPSCSTQPLGSGLSRAAEVSILHSTSSVGAQRPWVPPTQYQVGNLSHWPVEAWWGGAEAGGRERS